MLADVAVKLGPAEEALQHEDDGGVAPVMVELANNELVSSYMCAMPTHNGYSRLSHV